MKYMPAYMKGNRWGDLTNVENANNQIYSKHIIHQESAAHLPYNILTFHAVCGCVSVITCTGIVLISSLSYNVTVLQVIGV